MIIGLIGENCTGKSTIATELAKMTGATIYTGRDYFRLAKSEAEAKDKFVQLLNSGEEIIYVISDKKQLSLLPQQALRILISADLETIKERFTQRMNGNLPTPVANMLERNHGMFNGFEYDLRIENVSDDVVDVCGKIISLNKE